MKGRFNQSLITFFILILNIPAALTIDEHAPSLPAMTYAFDSTIPAMQFTITIYMLGMAISQWFCGALSDRFGRRPILMTTAFIYLVASLVCIFSTHYFELMVGRFFQGVGAGCFAMISPALMGEALEKERVGGVSAYFSMSYALIPILAPVIGGYIQEYVGWQGNFVLMFCLTFLITAFSFWKLPETHEPKVHHKLNMPQMMKNYGTVLGNGKYMAAVICMIFSWSAIIAFSVLGPFLIQGSLGLSSITYGHYALFVGLGFFAGNYANRFLIKMWKASKVIIFGLSYSILVSFVQLLLVLYGYFNATVIMVPTFLLMIGMGLIFPSFYGRAVTIFKDLVGIASALIGCLILIGAVICTAIMSAFEAHSAITLASVYLALCILCASVYVIGGMRKAR